MKIITHAVAGAVLCLAVAGHGQTTSQAVKTVQLSKVILDTESSEIKGKLKGGTLCVFPQKLPMIKGKKTQNYERYDQLFSSRMRGAGFGVVNTSADLFASDSSGDKGDYMVGATIRPDTINLCSSVSGEKGDVTLAVEWQIYDRNDHKVLQVITTTGHGVQEKFSRAGLTTMWNEAFTDSLSALIAQGVFDPYLGKARP